jgi:hypothetical protein
MPEDPASLQNLHDIVVPKPPPIWPPAPGVWVLLVIGLAVLAALALWFWRRHQRNAYRRAGLTLLEGVRSVREVNIVLKRVALAVWPRTEVAPLYGETWTAFLDQSCSQTHFGSLAAQTDEAEASRDLRRLARRWINHHHPPARGQG